MRQNILMLFVYILLIFYALTRITAWIGYSFRRTKGKEEHMDIFVTSGVGIYGSYMRLFTGGEIMNIHIQFS